MARDVRADGGTKMRRDHVLGPIAVAAFLACIVAAAGGLRSHSAASATTVTRTFTGQFAGNGTFKDLLCTYSTTYTGTVTLTLNFDSAALTGTARHQGRYDDALVSSPAECGGDHNLFDVTAPVSGTAQSVKWSFRHGSSGSVVSTASLIGSAFVGQATVTDPGFAGSATIAFTLNEVGGAPAQPPASGGSSSPPPANPTPSGAPAPAAAPPAAAPALTAAPPAQPPAPAAGAQGTAGANVPVQVPPVGAIAPVPTIGATRDAVPARAPVAREVCMQMSGDPDFWAQISDDLAPGAGGDDLPVPFGMLQQCANQYRANAWAPQQDAAFTKDGPAAPQGSDKTDPGPPPKATLETQTGFFLRHGERATVPVTNGANLGKGDTLITKSDAATVSFSDGSRVEVSANSAVLADPGGKSLVQLRGRMFMDIKSRNWVVRVPNVRGVVSLAVLGTKFSSEIAEDGTVRVEVTESAVQVTSGGKTVTVPAGTAIAVRPGEAPPMPPAPAADAMAPSQAPSRAVVYASVGVLALLAVAGALVLVRRSRSATGG